MSCNPLKIKYFPEYMATAGVGPSPRLISRRSSGNTTSTKPSPSSLCKAGRIRHVCRGVYDHPPFSDLLQQPLCPDIDQVAHALGRKFNWRIQPSGVAALNMLGLSTQVPGRWVYLSDGPNREYAIGKTLLVFA